MSRRLAKLGLISALCALAACAAAPAFAAASPKVRVGAPPPLPAKARDVGALAGQTRLRVTVALQARDPAALAAYATAVATPGSSVYHQYLTVAQFAQRFGPTTGQIGAVESALRAQGLDPGAATPNGLAIPVKATAAQLEHAFSIGLQRIALPGRRTAFANTAAPSVPARVAGDVQSVIGLDSVAVPRPVGVERSQSQAPAAIAAPQVVTGGPQPCAAATAATGGRAFTADQIASAYGFSGLYGAGDEGAGQTVALFELEGNFPTDLPAYKSCYGTTTSITYQQPPVDGGPAPPNPSNGDGVETELDADQLIGLAPKASIHIYQAPDTGQGAFDNFVHIITDNSAQVISTSWGLCEALLGSGEASAESSLFQEAATQGQTIVAAAGDNGAEDCSAQNQSTSLAVDDPGTQPFVTSVGGTTLNALGPPPSEVVWSDLCGGSPCGGGGGISTLWPMQTFQTSAPASLNVINAHSSGVPCGAATGGYCREVPDVSADADPSTGYVVYWNGGWTRVGGTSAAAPLWAALVALANASSGCPVAQPLGFLNPALYSVAGNPSAYASDFNDVTTGNNDILSTNHGLFPAGPGYDMGSGLGTPNGATLPAALCAAPRTTTTTTGPITTTTTTPTPTPTTTTPTPPPPSTPPAPATTISVANPGSQQGKIGEPQHLQMTSSISPAGAATGGPPTYSASGLPKGLSIDASSGMVSGTPTDAGASTVTVTASVHTGQSGQSSFSWTISGLPSASNSSLSGLSKRRPRLSFKVSAGTDAPALKAITVGLPSGLHFASSAHSLARGIRVRDSSGKALKFTVHGHGAVTISLGSTSGAVSVTIASPALAESAGLRNQVKRHKVKTLKAVLTATDASSSTSALGLALHV